MVLALLAALAHALIAFALSSAWFGSVRAWSSWRAVLGELMGEYEHTLEAGNFSLARVLERSGPGVHGLLRAAGTCGLALIALEPLRDALGFEESSILAARLVCAGAALLFLAGLYDLAALERRAAA